MDMTAAVCAAREILQSETPLKTDCGQKCGHACCLPDERGRGGMLLFPGEESLLREDASFTFSSDSSIVMDAVLASCPGKCNRDNRPLSCRFFPLRPSVKHVICLDRRSLSVCPLTESGLQGLNPSFVKAAHRAAEVLLSVPEERIFIEQLGRGILQAAREAMPESL